MHFSVVGPIPFLLAAISFPGHEVLPYFPIRPVTRVSGQSLWQASATGLSQAPTDRPLTGQQACHRPVTSLYSVPTGMSQARFFVRVADGCMSQSGDSFALSITISY